MVGAGEGKGGGWCLGKGWGLRVAWQGLGLVGEGWGQQLGLVAGQW